MDLQMKITERKQKENGNTHIKKGLFVGKKGQIMDENIESNNNRKKQ